MWKSTIYKKKFFALSNNSQQKWIYPPRRKLIVHNMEAKIEKMKYEHLMREAALVEKELLEEEYKKKFDEAKKELSLENDIACMWVLVAKLKRGALDISDLNVDDRTKV